MARGLVEGVVGNSYSSRITAAFRSPTVAVSVVPLTVGMAGFLPEVHGALKWRGQGDLHGAPVRVGFTIQR